MKKISNTSAVEVSEDATNILHTAKKIVSDAIESVIPIDSSLMQNDMLNCLEGVAVNLTVDALAQETMSAFFIIVEAYQTFASEARYFSSQSAAWWKFRQVEQQTERSGFCFATDFRFTSGSRASVTLVIWWILAAKIYLSIIAKLCSQFCESDLEVAELLKHIFNLERERTPKKEAKCSPEEFHRLVRVTRGNISSIAAELGIGRNAVKKRILGFFNSEQNHENVRTLPKDWANLMYGFSSVMSDRKTRKREIDCQIAEMMAEILRSRETQEFRFSSSDPI